MFRSLHEVPVRLTLRLMTIEAESFGELTKTPHSVRAENSRPGLHKQARLATFCSQLEQTAFCGAAEPGPLMAPPMQVRSAAACP